MKQQNIKPKDSDSNVIKVPLFYINEYDNNRREIFEYRKEMATKQAILEDYELDSIINNDIQDILDEVGGQDGMYENFPISRVYRDNNTVRVYALDSNGGITIISYKNKRFQILTLGEDDAWHFLNSRRIYENYYGSKQSFVYLLSEALSLFNNIKL